MQYMLISPEFSTLLIEKENFTRDARYIVNLAQKKEKHEEMFSQGVIERMINNTDNSVDELQRMLALGFYRLCKYESTVNKLLETDNFWNKLILLANISSKIINIQAKCAISLCILHGKNIDTIVVDSLDNIIDLLKNEQIDIKIIGIKCLRKIVNSDKLIVDGKNILLNKEGFLETLINIVETNNKSCICHSIADLCLTLCKIEKDKFFQFKENIKRFELLDLSFAKPLWKEINDILEE